MASVTLTTLLSRARERADMINSQFVTDAKFTDWINEANQRLHGMLVEAMGEEYVSLTSAFTTAANTSDYPLPASFYKLYGVDLNYHGYWHSLERFERPERNVYREAHHTMPRYALVGSNLRLYPIPSVGLTGSIIYAPEATVLVNPSDTVSYPNGWEKFVVIDAAIQALLKEESDVRGLSAERAAIVREIEVAKENRDMATPKYVTDTSLLNFDFDLYR